VLLTPEEELREAMEQWLYARDTFHGERSNGVGVLSGFMEAHRRLLSAFDDGWSGGDTKLLSDGYHRFLKALVQSRKCAQEVRGFSRLT